MQAANTGVQNATLLFHTHLMSSLCSQFSEVNLGLCRNSRGLRQMLGIREGCDPQCYFSHMHPLSHQHLREQVGCTGHQGMTAPAEEYPVLAHMTPSGPAVITAISTPL